MAQMTSLARRGGVAVAAARRGFSSSSATKIALYDTTLRDGTQGEGVSLSLHDKLAIAEYVARDSTPVFLHVL